MLLIHFCLMCLSKGVQKSLHNIFHHHCQYSSQAITSEQDPQIMLKGSIKILHCKVCYEMPSSIPLRVMLMKYNWIYCELSFQAELLVIFSVSHLVLFLLAYRMMKLGNQQPSGQYVGVWQLGSLKYHLAFWSKN